MRNIELKARLRDRREADRVCASLDGTFQGKLRQTDTYFRVAKGRLKMRECTPGSTELIFYLRPDHSKTRASDYQITPADFGMKAMLVDALGILKVVRKTRALWIWRNVRIHLDAVDGLGDFIEFEAVLDDDHGDAEGHAHVAELRAAFGLTDEDLIGTSYCDLVAARG